MSQFRPASPLELSQHVKFVLSDFSLAQCDIWRRVRRAERAFSGTDSKLGRSRPDGLESRDEARERPRGGTAR